MLVAPAGIELELAQQLYRHQPSDPPSLSMYIGLFSYMLVSFFVYRSLI